MSIVYLPAAETLLSAVSSVTCVWFRVFMSTVSYSVECGLHLRFLVNVSFYLV